MSAEVASRPLPVTGSWRAYQAGRGGRFVRAQRWLRTPATLTVVVVAYFVLVENHTSPALLGAVVLSAGVVWANSRPHPRVDRCELALTSNLALLIAFPFAHLPHDRLTSYVVLLTLLATAGSALRYESWSRLPSGTVQIGLLFTLLAVVSALSPDSGALKTLITIAAAALPQFLLASRLGPLAGRSLAVSIVALGCVESVLAILEPVVFPHHLWTSAPTTPVSGPDQLASSILPGMERSYATLGLPLPLGLLLVVALALLTRTLGDLDRRLRFGVTVLLAGGVVLAGDRNALITAAVVIACGKRLSGRTITLAVLAAILVLLVSLEAGVVSGSTIEHFLQSGSYQHRVAAYSSFHKLIDDQTTVAALFGNGYAATPRIFALGLLQNDTLDVVDNEFISMLLQGGLLCLFVLLGLAGTAIVRARSELRLVAVSVVVIMVVFDSLLWPSATALTFLVFGLVLNPQGRAAETPEVASHNPQVST